MAGGGRIVSVSTVLFDGYPFALALEEIARAGATHVEPAFIRGYVDFTEDDFSEGAARELAGSIAEAGLKVHALSAHMDLSGAEARSMLARRIAFAEALGARVLITNAGPERAADTVLATIMALLPRIEAWGGMLAIENPGHGSGDLVGTAEQGRRLVERIGSPHVRLNHDAGNVFTYSHERLQPAGDYLAAREAIGHAHLKDVKSTPEGWSFCATGSGDVDLKHYLDAIPPDLPVSLELPLRLRRPGRQDPQRATEPLPVEQLRAALEASLAFVSSAARPRPTSARGNSA